MAKDLLTIRCPEDIRRVIEERMTLTQLGKTDVVVDMLRQSLPSVLLGDRSKLPQIAAIYFVHQGNKLLYIGKSENLRQRWYSHHRLVQFLNTGDNVYISWFPYTQEDSNQSLVSIEESLIELLEPDYNGVPLPESPKNSRVIPVRMPEDLYDDVVTSKPPELKLGTWLLMILRKGLDAGIDTSCLNVVNTVDTAPNQVLVSSLQSRLTALEERLDATQRIVDSADDLRLQASEALSNIDTIVEQATQKAVDSVTTFVDRRVHEAIEQEVTELLEK